MSEKYESDPYVPEYLRKVSVGEMPIDTVYFVRTDPSGVSELGDYATAWVDEATGRMCTDRSAMLGGIEQSAVDEVDDRVAIMKVLVMGADKQPRIGYIADVRYMDAGVMDVVAACEDECCSDQLQPWERSAVQFDAVISSGTNDEDEWDGQYVLAGDSVFHDALRYLADEVDSMLAQQAAVTEGAGHQEVSVPEAEMASQKASDRIRRAFGKLARKVLQRVA